ncbi:MAG: hypothetical protein B0W54_08170 [Cellvibrio sp. 79]|nr:MAG: hypothetical protein B0W54_08170 [Cellvibrio sp. 79]
MPHTPIQIIEITKQASQGRSEPYLCVGEDGRIYYVKGRQSGLPTRINEWICAHLGRAFGLPIPEFRLAKISSELLGVTSANLRSIGVGLGFASQEVPLACWFEEANKPKVDDELQQKLLIFDWWIRNDDRGNHNPNLLWDSAHQRIAVIDHNLAFDPEFDAHSFINSHIFGHHWDTISSDLVTRSSYQQQLEAALPALDQALASMPDEWHWVDVEQTMPATLDVNQLRNQLLRCTTDDFWRAE